MRLLVCAFTLGDIRSPLCLFHPISLLARKETGWNPKETRLWRGLYRIRDVLCVSPYMSGCPARRITANLTFAGGERAHPVLRCRRRDTANAACDPLS